MFVAEHCFQFSGIECKDDENANNRLIALIVCYVSEWYFQLTNILCYRYFLFFLSPLKNICNPLPVPYQVERVTSIFENLALLCNNLFRLHYSQIIFRLLLQFNWLLKFNLIFHNNLNIFAFLTREMKPTEKNAMLRSVLLSHLWQHVDCLWNLSMTAFATTVYIDSMKSVTTLAH